MLIVRLPHDKANNATLINKTIVFFLALTLQLCLLISHEKKETSINITLWACLVVGDLCGVQTGLGPVAERGI